MKIVCDSCQAKYSIADEKVVGKVFKIRCKRCGNTIVVRTDEQGAAGGGGGGAAAAGEAIWHVVVNGEQHGPYDPAQLGEMLTGGTVDWEAYVWCEGFENWMPMRDVEDLVAQITGQGQPGQQRQSAPRASAVNYSTPPSMGADPFADDAQSGASPFDPPAMDAGPDLFGPSAQSGRFDKPPAPTATAAAPMPSSADQPMTGVRNENSVLFSLKNLQALATGSSPSNPPPTVQPGFATGEGSGLIDIRALATATGVGSGDGAGEKDDLLSMGAHQGGAFGALGSPMLAPVADEGDTNRKTLILAGVAATAFLSVAAIAIVYILRPQSAPTPQTVVAVPTPVAPAPAVPTAAPAPGQPVPAPGAAPAQPPSEGAAAAQKAAEPAPTPAGDAAKRKRPAAAAGATKSAGGIDDLLAPSKEAAKPAAPKGPRTIDDLLDTALEGKSAAKPAAAGGSSGSLPDAPPREDVKRALDGVKGAVQGCAQGQGGVAIVEVTVAGSSGRVTSAQVEGITGPAGSCIAREVRKASFPKFKNAVFKVKYPYRL